jgi:hypothetical protein
MIFSVKTFQVWNKDDYARQLLIDRKDETMTSSNNVEQNKNQVKKNTGNATKSFRLDFCRSLGSDNI